MRQTVDISSIILSDVVKYMQKSHGAQVRKDGSPYWCHPWRVWMMIRTKLGIRDNLIEFGALLHDVVEDTDISTGDIVQWFGPKVAEIVSELTNDNSLPRDMKKNKMCEKAAFISNQARIIKCCDRIDNLQSAFGVMSYDWIQGYLRESHILRLRLRMGIRKDKWDVFCYEVTNMLDNAINALSDASKIRGCTGIDRIRRSVAARRG